MREFNFDGLVGPTHNYAGLSYGNIASLANAGSVANPRLAAKQGLQKMRLLMDLGVPQALLPPHQRPNLSLLRTLGFSGKPIQMLQQANKVNPALLAAVYSAASMWTANMATVSPSSDTQDGKVHFTPANLTYNLHRAQEAKFSYKLLQTIFNDPKHFVIHTPLPPFRDLSDEGAANHSRLCVEYGKPGLEMFVYGRDGLDEKKVTDQKYPARQTKLASVAVMQKHSIITDSTIVLKQSQQAIDAGAFHNDVVFVANKNVMLYHALAFEEWQNIQGDIANFFTDGCYFIEVSPEELSLSTAIETYLFNSQLVSIDDDMVLIAPMECKESDATVQVINSILAADNPIKKVVYVQCRQSMRNGGGPACLRMRVVLSREEQAGCLQSIFMTPDLYNKLDKWIDKHYRESLSPKDLLDPLLYTEVQTALDELTQLLALGSIYPFQQR